MRLHDFASSAIAASEYSPEKRGASANTARPCSDSPTVEQSTRTDSHLRRNLQRTSSVAAELALLVGPPEIITNRARDALGMSSIRGIRRKKSSLTDVKIAVVGAPGVGKTALTVRFLTKRYIGEYDHQTESRYKHEALVDGEPVLFEILDTCPAKGEEGCLCSAESALWADGFLFVYSITDRRSFTALRGARQAVCEWREACGVWPVGSPPVVLVASKADMVHLRQVTTEEGEILAKDLECPYCEVTAAEQVLPVTAAFHEICREVLASRRRGKQSLLDRMLGSKTTRQPPPGPRTYSRGKSDSALP